MQPTEIITVDDPDTFANKRDSEAVVPELSSSLIHDSVPDLTACRIPYGDAINQPGLDRRPLCT
jgi:hypothetical protein